MVLKKRGGKKQKCGLSLRVHRLVYSVVLYYMYTIIVVCISEKGLYTVFIAMSIQRQL